MSREVRPQQPMPDVRAPYAHASPRSLREHPRPCATLVRALGAGRGGPQWRVPLGERAVAVERVVSDECVVADERVVAQPRPAEPRAPLGECVVAVDAGRRPTSERRMPVGDEVVPC